jgi:hypothetical protein
MNAKERNPAMIRATLTLTLAIASVAGALLALSSPAVAEDAAHKHMRHVMENWKDTPGNTGLLPMAEMESEVARRHAGFAAKTPDDLKNVKIHVRHVVHALDPTVEPTGPGRGYGVKQAAQGVAFHIRAAAKSDEASENVKLHAPHVATSAENAVERADDALVLAAEILAAEDAVAAADILETLQADLAAMVGGEDQNGDGEITWKEGGLAQARQHMRFMYEGEGMELPE